MKATMGQLSFLNMEGPMGTITTREMTGRGVLMGKRAWQESTVCAEDQ